jgi:hypothetical protein
MKSWHPFAFVSLVVAGCGGGGSTDIEGTLVFAERSDLEIARLINAAGGTDMFMVQGQIDQFGDTFDTVDPCPTIAIDGDTATITGGCTTADGVMIGGTALAVNPFSWDQIDYEGGDSMYEAHALSFTQSGFTRTYDGFISRPGDFSTWDADVTVTESGVAMRSDLYYHCSNPSNPSCSVSGSGLEMIGVGGATVSGKVRVNLDTGESTADYTLKGADTLTVHITRTCVEWQVEGTERRSVCTN